VLIPNKIKTAYKPLDEIGLREEYQTLNKNELFINHTVRKVFPV